MTDEEDRQNAALNEIIKACRHDMADKMTPEAVERLAPGLDTRARWLDTEGERGDGDETVVSYRGMLQGLIHNLFKEADPPYFLLRDLASQTLIKCHYEPEQSEQVYKALEDRRAVVVVAGWINARRADRSISSVRVERIQATERLNYQELKKFFGSVPGWTGDLTTDAFIESMRRRWR